MWESRVCCGISKCGEERWKSRDRNFCTGSTARHFHNQAFFRFLRRAGFCWVLSEVLGMECGGRWHFAFLAYPRRKNRRALCQSPWPGHALWPQRRRWSNYLEFASVFFIDRRPTTSFTCKQRGENLHGHSNRLPIQRAHVIKMEMCCRASTSLLTKFAAVVNRALQFLPARGEHNSPDGSYRCRKLPSPPRVRRDRVGRFIG
jgi:hypothetical protein